MAKQAAAELGQNERRLVSPVAPFPGSVIVPIVLSAEDFQIWYDKSAVPAEDLPPNRHSFFDAYEKLSHLIKAWEIDGVTPKHTAAADGTGLPAMQLVVWLVKELDNIVREGFNLPNLSEPSSDT